MAFALLCVFGSGGGSGSRTCVDIGCSGTSGIRGIIIDSSSANNNRDISSNGSSSNRNRSSSSTSSTGSR